MSGNVHFEGAFEVKSDKVQYTDDAITAQYDYQTTVVKTEGGKTTLCPKTDSFTFKTERKVPRTGVMFVGWAGNNGSTVTACIMANKKKMTWQTKEREVKSNYFGSITQASTVRIGSNESGDSVHMPLKCMLPMVDPNDLEITGWDICDTPLGDAMKRAAVLDIDLQKQLYDDLQKLKPLPSVYFPDFIAANQAERANNALTGSKQEQLEKIQKDIRDFKSSKNLDKVQPLGPASASRLVVLILRRVRFAGDCAVDGEHGALRGDPDGRQRQRCQPPGRHQARRGGGAPHNSLLLFLAMFLIIFLSSSFFRRFFPSAFFSSSSARCSRRASSSRRSRRRLCLRWPLSSRAPPTSTALP
eukprot:3576187-Rhodomonas_salina.1